MTRTSPFDVLIATAAGAGSQVTLRSWLVPSRACSCSSGRRSGYGLIDTSRLRSFIDQRSRNPSALIAATSASPGPNTAFSICRLSR